MYKSYENDKILVKTHPSPRQLVVEEMEFYAFAHFTVNTFTDKEWGDGTEPESVFDPSELDANQWVDALKAAGVKGTHPDLQAPRRFLPVEFRLYGAFCEKQSVPRWKRGRCA